MCDEAVTWQRHDVRAGQRMYGVGRGQRRRRAVTDALPVVHRPVAHAAEAYAEALRSGVRRCRPRPKRRAAPAMREESLTASHMKGRTRPNPAYPFMFEIPA